VRAARRQETVLQGAHVRLERREERREGRQEDEHADDGRTGDRRPIPAQATPQLGQLSSLSPASWSVSLAHRLFQVLQEIPMTNSQCPMVAPKLVISHLTLVIAHSYRIRGSKKA
jgi:hypothetical protein